MTIQTIHLTSVTDIPSHVTRIVARWPYDGPTSHKYYERRIDGWAWVGTVTSSTSRTDPNPPPSGFGPVVEVVFPKLYDYHNDLTKGVTR